MISGSIGVLGKFRLWCNENYIAGCEFSEVYGSNLCSIKEAETSGVRELVLEVMIPRGGRALYALLGLRYQTSAKEFEINTLSPPSISKVFHGSLIEDFEVAHFGLPLEFAAASVAGLKRGLAANNDINRGRIDICCAAYGDVSSNEPLFEKVGFALAHFVRLPCKEISEEVIGTFFIT
jgi:hypothetical protein